MIKFSKEHTAYYDQDCDNCGEVIEEGETMFFVVNDGDKWCEECVDDHIEQQQNKLL